MSEDRNLNTMITIEPVDIKHADILMDWRHQPSTVKYNPVKDLSKEELIKSIQSKHKNLSKLVDNASFRWVGLTESGEPFGHVSLNFVNTMMWTAEIGYIMGEKYQGQGLGTRFVRQIVEMVFEQTPIRKLYAHVHDKNIPSQKLIEKIGFKREGLMREHYLINGKPENEIFYGLLRDAYLN